MKLEKNRELEYKEKIIDIPHPFVKYKKIIFKGKDNSQIKLDLAIPKSKIKGIIVDFPEFKVKNKDYLNLTKYSMLNYALASLHIRGQAGNSENKTPCSHFPFFDNNSSTPYFKLVFQDALDTISIIEKLFPNKKILVTGLGQGAAISIVCASYYDSIKELFILDCSLCDIKNTYKNNKKDIDSIFEMCEKQNYRWEIDMDKKITTLMYLNYKSNNLFNFIVNPIVNRKQKELGESYVN